MTGGSTSGSAAASEQEGGNDAEKKMFFTTSDLITRMNSAMKDGNVHAASPSSDPGGFELQTKMPDGSYRRAEESEMAAADFQAKMKQASEMIKSLNPEQKIEWAKHQRQEGNDLFAKGDYKEAMDVYLTCLVAMDKSSSAVATNTKNPSIINDDSNELLSMQIETEIKLPVLLNLALSAMKMGMLSKSEKFCNFAMEMESGRQSVKAHFRRARVRMLMGQYVSAELDLDMALELNAKVLSDDEADRLKETENERVVILREKQKLNRLVGQAEKNRQQQKKAMERLFKSGKNEDEKQQAALSTRGISSLYPEKKGPVQVALQQNGHTCVLEDGQLTCFQWYMRMIGRCAQKLLDIIGEEEENTPLDVPVDEYLLDELIENKKDV